MSLVTFISRASWNPTSASTVTFNVNFLDDVTGVDATDFVVTAPGITGAVVTDVSGSGKHYIVTVSTGTGEGTLRLDVVDDDTIVWATPFGYVSIGGPGPGNGNYSFGDAYTIDRDVDNVPPELLSFVRAGSSPTNAASFDYTLTFSENVGGVDASDFQFGHWGFSSAPSISNISGSGTTWTVTINTGSGDGEITLGLRALAGTGFITDAAGIPINTSTSGWNTTVEWIPLTFPFQFETYANFNAESFFVDRTAPTVSSVVRASPDPTNAASVDYTVTFSESVTGVDASDFALTTTGISGASIANVSGSGDTWTVTVNTGTGEGTIRLDVLDDDTIADGATNTLAGGFTAGEAYELDYTAPTDITLLPGSVDENSAAGTVVGTLAATDSGPGSTAAFALVSGVGDTDNGLFEVFGDELRVKSGAQLDYEQHAIHSVRVSVTDAAGNSFEKILAVTVTDVVESAYLTQGNDKFTAPTGMEIVRALYGLDTITFDFKLTEATITYDNDKVIIDGPGGSHSVVAGFERYVFTDGTVNNADGNDLVDDLFYYARNHDVWNAHLDADAHYAQIGWKQLRDPSAFFSTVIYLSENPHLKGGNVSPVAHFHDTGWKSGMAPSLNFDPAAYLDAYPDVKAAGIDPLAHFLYWGRQEGRQAIAPTEIIGKGGFDYVWYLQNNPDVAAAKVDPLVHFQAYGWKEGRDPNALFDTSGYLATYTDVAAAGVNPLDHYNAYGWKEGRDPSVGFDTTDYLSTYTDVAAAKLNPLFHYLVYGQDEGRSPFADGLWG